MIADSVDSPARARRAAAGAAGPLVAGVFAAFGASTCCAGPLLLVWLGAGGVWIARLRALEPLQPLFLLLALLAVGWAFHRLYIAPRRCAPERACASAAALRRQRIGFWATFVLIKALILFPWVAPHVL